MLTLVSALDRTVRLYGDRPAIVDPEGTFSWREFLERVQRGAGLLQGLGVRSGDRFGIISRNSFRQQELINAGHWMGAIPVPINFRLAPPEIRFILDDAGCGVLAVEDYFLDLLPAGDLAVWRDRAFCLSAEPAGDLAHYEALLAEAEPAPAHESAEEEDAYLFYTGGTTGRGKGVRLTHRNVVSNGLQMVGQMRVRSDDIYLHVAPMFHSADLLGTAFILLGAGHAYLPQFTPEALLTRIATLRTTAVMLTPTMIISTLQQCDPGDYDLSSLRYLYYGSSPMAAEWVERAFAAFPGVDIEQGYGLTETSPILTTLDVEEHRSALVSGDLARLRGAGRPIVGVDMRIVDDDDQEVPTGGSGEIVVRGPNVTAGYLNRPEEEATAFRGGWFHTGDIGRMDERGFLYVQDRKKDVIITGGENVYSSEVEAALYQHPDIHEAAVVAVPDERYGEALFAVIVPAPGKTLTVEGVIAHCRERIGGYKIPRRMAVVDELPKSAMGKILKTELRRIYGG